MQQQPAQDPKMIMKDGRNAHFVCYTCKDTIVQVSSLPDGRGIFDCAAGKCRATVDRFVECTVCHNPSRTFEDETKVRCIGCWIKTLDISSLK